MQRKLFLILAICVSAFVFSANASAQQQFVASVTGPQEVPDRGSPGKDTDVPLFGDYDGDGKTDIVARRVTGGQMIWYIYQSSNGQGRAVPFGAPGDQ